MALLHRQAGCRIQDIQAAIVVSPPSSTESFSDRYILCAGIFRTQTLVQLFRIRRFWEWFHRLIHIRVWPDQAIPFLSSLMGELRSHMICVRSVQVCGRECYLRGYFAQSGKISGLKKKSIQICL